MKKIALFGATGQTGQKFLELAINQGYEIKVLVRDKSKLKTQRPRIAIVEGDVLNPEDVNSVVEGTEIVVSLFGHVKGSPEWLQTNGTKNIISAMQNHGVERIISLSGGGLPFPEKDKPKLVDHLIRTIMKIAVPKVLNDAIAHADVLKSSGKKWVVVRGPRLTNDPGTGSYRVGWVGVNASTKISRADLAKFILTQVEDESFNFQMPFVSV
ncbi:MAG: NAD(P)-dependent oxidoreductase [Saprospiraceae bacterium]